MIYQPEGGGQKNLSFFRNISQFSHPLVHLGTKTPPPAPNLGIIPKKNSIFEHFSYDISFDSCMLKTCRIIQQTQISSQE